VAPEFATPERPAFTPGGGFAGMEYLAAVSKRYTKLWVGGFVRYDTLGGAAFAESPLVTSKHYFAAGFGLAWILGESTERVAVNPFDERSVR
jgi:outer membrane scaffolding protein for murein synthesis (MipA/OmpV family)